MKRRKILAMLITVVVLIALVCLSAVSVSAADAVSYVEANGTAKSVTEYSEVTSETTTLTSGTWVVKDTVTVESRITISGDVTLILTEGCTLNAKGGIALVSPNTLTVYGGNNKTDKTAGALIGSLTSGSLRFVIGTDSSSETMGTLTVNSGYVYAYNGVKGGAGAIGGSGSCGTITVNGGHLRGDMYSGDSDAAAVGDLNGNGSITVNGGLLTAIGGGNSSGIRCSTLRVNAGGAYITGGEGSATAGDGVCAIDCDTVIERANVVIFPKDGGSETSGTMKNASGNTLYSIAIELPEAAKVNLGGKMASFDGSNLGSYGGVSVPVLYNESSYKNYIRLWFPVGTNAEITKITLDNGLAYEGTANSSTVALSKAAGIVFEGGKDTLNNSVTGSMAKANSVDGEVTLPENGFTVPAGHTFGGWRINGNIYAAGDIIPVTEDTVATAVWTANTYTKKIYYVNVLGEPLEQVYSGEHAYGTVMTVDSPVIDGYVCSTPTVSLTVTDGEPIYVVYKAVITLNAGDGATVDPATVLFNGEFVSDLGNLPTPVKDGYFFTGWYLENGTPVDAWTQVLAPTTFYARYEQMEYRVTTSVTDGYTYTVNGIVITKAGDYTVELLDGVTSAAHGITVDADGKVKLTIKDISVATTATDDVALRINSDTELILSGVNTMKGAYITPAISVGAGGSLTVSGSGSLTVTAGDSAAVTGWAYSAPAISGDITVNGGTVKAIGGDGIEGEHDTCYGSVAIDGVVTVNGGKLIAIGGKHLNGKNSSAVKDVDYQNNTRTKYGENESKATYDDRYVYLDPDWSWPTAYLEVDVAEYSLIVTGGTLGTDYTYANGVLEFIKGGSYSVKQAPGVEHTDHSIVIGAEGVILDIGDYWGYPDTFLTLKYDAEVIFSGEVKAYTLSTAVKKASEGEVTLTLTAKEESILRPNTAGFIPIDGVKLVLKPSKGSLYINNAFYDTEVTSSTIVGAEGVTLFVRARDDSGDLTYLPISTSYTGGKSVLLTAGYTVTYTDGVAGEEIFADKINYIYEGDAAPAFGSDPVRAGYKFLGWDKEIASAVTESVTYTALWEEKLTIQLNTLEQAYTYDGTEKPFELIGDMTDGFTINYEDGQGYGLLVPPNTVGIYTVTIERDEDDTYKAYSNVTLLVIHKADTEVSFTLPQSTIAPAQKMKITPSLIWGGNTDNTVKFTVSVKLGDGEPVVTNDHSGEFLLTCPSDAVLGDTLVFTVSFEGNKNLKESSKSVEFTIGQVDYSADIDAVDQKIEDLEAELLNYYTKTETDAIIDAVEDLIGELPADTAATTIVEYIDSVGKTITDLVGELPDDTNADTVVDYITEVKKSLSDLIGELPTDTTATTIVEYIDSVGKTITDLVGELPDDTNADTVVDYITEVKKTLSDLIGELPADTTATTIVEYIDSVGKTITDLVGELPDDTNADTVVDYITEVKKTLSDLIGELPADTAATTIVEYIQAVGKSITDFVGQLPDGTSAETVVDYIDLSAKNIKDFIGELPDGTSATTVVAYIQSVDKAIRDLIGELPADADAETVIEYIDLVGKLIREYIGELPTDTDAETVVAYVQSVDKAIRELIGELPEGTTAKTVIEYVDLVGKIIRDYIGELPEDTTAETVTGYIQDVTKALRDFIGELPEDTEATTVVGYINSIYDIIKAQNEIFERDIMYLKLKLGVAKKELTASIEKVKNDLFAAEEALDEKIAANSARIDEEVKALSDAISEAKELLEIADAELLEKLSAAESTLKEAIDKVAEDLAKAKTELDAAIKKGDDDLSAEIEALEKALDAAEAAYEAADTALGEDVANAKSELKAAIASGDKANADALKAEAEKLREEIADARVLPLVIAFIAVGGNVILAIVIIVGKRKKD